MPIYLRSKLGGLLPLLFLLLPGASSHAATEMIDQVVAIVDDDVVMASELRERVALVTQTIAARGMEAPPEDELIRETLDRLILESIQMQMGARFGVRIADAQLDAAMGRVAAQNGLSLAQFRVALEQQGRSYLAMREGIRQEMIVQRVQQGNVNQRIQISDQEIENYLATEEGQRLVQPEYRIVHALLPLSEDIEGKEADAARAYAASLISRIRDGESFEAVIGSANGERYSFSGGDLGWRKLGDLPSIFQDVATQLKAGETADAFRSPSGFHIVYMAERRGDDATIAQTKVRHILIKPSEILTEAQAEEKAAQLKARILAGEDFAALARQFSEDIGSAAEGGDLGWTSPGQMVPAFENAVDSAETGTISDPVRTDFGYHIIEVLDRRNKDMTEELRRAQIREFLHSRKYEEELDAWLRKIRDEAFVDIK